MSAQQPSRPEPDQPDPSTSSLRQELEVTLAARHELGLDAALVESFVERIEAEIDRRVEAGIAAREQSLKRRGRSGWSYVASGVVAMTTLTVAVPLTALAASAGPLGIAIVWVAILIINLLVVSR